NQLADEHCGDLLAQTGIVYAPDYLVNAGGMIAYAESRHPQGFRRQRALAHVSRIADTLERVFAIAREQAIPTYRAADWLAEQRIASVRQAKTLATAPYEHSSPCAGTGLPADHIETPFVIMQ